MRCFNELNSICIERKFIVQNHIDINEKVNIENSITFLGNLKTTDDILAKHSCIIFGNVKADKLMVFGDLTVLGDFNVKEAEIHGKLMLLGEVDCNNLYCGGNIIISNGKVKNIQGDKNLYVERVLEIDDVLEVERGAVFLEGVIGSGSLKAASIIAGEYCEVENTEGQLILLDTAGREEKKSDLILKEVKAWDIINKSESFKILNQVNENMINQLEDIILHAEESLEYDEISKMLEVLSENFHKFEKDKEIFDKILEYSELSSVDKLMEYLLLSDIYEIAPLYLRKISIVEDTHEYLIKAHMKFADMSVKVGSFSELLELLNLLQKQKTKLGSNEYRTIIQKIDAQYDTNFENLVMQLQGGKIETTSTSAEYRNILRVFQEEIPEIRDGSIEVKDIVTYENEFICISLRNKDSMIDPIRTCLGHGASRYIKLTRLLENKKISLVQWEQSPMEYIRSVLNLEKNVKIELNSLEKTAMIYLPEERIPRTIGKHGSRIKATNELTGLKVTIVKQVV